MPRPAAIPAISAPSHRSAIAAEADGSRAARGFAMGILLSLPVWGILVWAIWSLG